MHIITQLNSHSLFCIQQTEVTDEFHAKNLPYLALEYDVCRQYFRQIELFIINTK